jgi:pimeloyl-ACP methyl ester carboxylesterase
VVLLGSVGPLPCLDGFSTTLALCGARAAALATADDKFDAARLLEALGALNLTDPSWVDGAKSGARALLANAVFASGQGAVVVAFRGTFGSSSSSSSSQTASSLSEDADLSAPFIDALRDEKWDVAFPPQPTSFHHAGCGSQARVNALWSAASQELGPRLSAELDRRRTAFALPPALVLVGHSTGGALALLTASAFRLKRVGFAPASPVRAIGVLTLGAPRAGNAAWAECYASLGLAGSSWLLARELDPVANYPRFSDAPSGGAVHPAPLVVLGRNLNTAWLAIDGAALERPSDARLEQHSLDGYAQALGGLACANGGVTPVDVRPANAFATADAAASAECRWDPRLIGQLAAPQKLPL